MLWRCFDAYDRQASAFDGYYGEHNFAQSLAEFDRVRHWLNGVFLLAAEIDPVTAVHRAQSLHSDILRPFVLIAVADTMTTPPTFGRGGGLR